MKKTACFVGAFLVCAGLAVSFFVVGGCEDDQEVDGIRYLTLTPSSARVGTNITWFTIAVIDGTRDLSLPLDWSVDDPRIGVIREPTAGLSAIYARCETNGTNVVRVRDQYSVEGYCHILQVDEATLEPAGTPLSNLTPNEPVTTTTTTTTTTTIP